MESLYPNRAEQDEALVDLSKALTAYEYMYMELGMKAGARLVYELLLAED